MSEIAREEASEYPFWRVPWEFAVHAVVGTIIFAIIAGVAVLLDLAVIHLGDYRTATGHQIDLFIIYGMKSAEYALFAVDLLLFGIFLWRTAVRKSRHL